MPGTDVACAATRRSYVATRRPVLTQGHGMGVALAGEKCRSPMPRSPLQEARPPELELELELERASEPGPRARGARRRTVRKQALDPRFQYSLHQELERGFSGLGVMAHWPGA
eukprot:1344370-Rhodomonas_salina.1